MHKFLFVWINAKAISINNAVQLISDAHLFRISILFLLFIFHRCFSYFESQQFFFVAVFFIHRWVFSFVFFHSPMIFFIRRFFLFSAVFLFTEDLFFFLLKYYDCNNFLLIGLLWCDLDSLHLAVTDSNFAWLRSIYSVIVCNIQISENN